MASKRRYGGSASVTLFARLLGLAKPASPGTIRRIALDQHRIEIEIDLGNQPSIQLLIEDRAAHGDYLTFVATDHLAIWYRGAGLPPSFEATLRASLRRWQTVAFDKLAQAIRVDPELGERPPASSSPGGEAEAGGGQDPAADDRPGIGTFSPGSFHADMLGVQLLEFMPFETIEASNRLVRISHSDLECVAFMPQEKPSNMYVVDFPWIAGAQTDSRPIKELEKSYCTDLTELDIIMGSVPKARESLLRAIEENPGTPIVFSNTCLPATTGEDVVSLLKQVMIEHDVTVECHNRALETLGEDMFEKVIQRKAREARGRPSERVAGAVNLVGFARNEPLTELESLLRDRGLTVNAVVLPSLAPAELDRFPDAVVNVLHRSSRRWDHLHARLAEWSDSPWVEPPPPFGIAGTRAWLDAVSSAAAVGRGSGTAEVLPSALAQEWEELRAAAGGHGLGLVLRERDVPDIEDPAATAGVPVLPVLNEIGFGLEILVEGAAGPLTRRVEAAAPGARVETFSGLTELRAILRRSEVDAVLSNYRFDWRLTEAGKNRFSLADFEMGARGALRTARRLISRCRARFFREYSAYLQRDAVGRRLVEE